MYPHERSLVERMSNRPFSLLGINTDALDVARSAVRDNNLTWRSWADEDTGGPICRQYGVRSFPTIYVIDHHGVIRYKNVRGDALDEAVDELVEEAEADGATPGAPYGQPEPREFTDASGENTFMALFLKFENGKAFLQKEDGEVLQMSMNDLSAADQEWIRSELRRLR